MAKTISGLTAATQANLTDLLETSQVDGPGWLTKKLTLQQVLNSAFQDSVVLTDDYVIQDTDAGKTFILSGSEPKTITLPNLSIPNFKFTVINLGSAQWYFGSPGTVFGNTTIEGTYLGNTVVAFQPQLISPSVWYTGIPSQPFRTITMGEPLSFNTCNYLSPFTLCNFSSLQTIVLPLDDLPTVAGIQTGDSGQFLQINTGTVEFVITNGVTVYCQLGKLVFADGITPKIAMQGGSAIVQKIGADTYWIGGNISS